jgi:hypothetical protein
VNSALAAKGWTPKEVLAKHFGVPENAFAGLPEKELKWLGVVST